MANQYPYDIHVGEQPVLLQKRKRVGALGLLSGLIFIAGASSLLWVNYDRLLEASSAKPVAAPVAATAPTEEQVSLADFQALQRQTTDSLQSAGQLAEAQQTELKRLSDQVAALTAKIDQIQGQGSNISAPRTADPPRPASASSSTPAVQRRRPTATQAPQPAGGISLGGAPLPGAPPPPSR